MKELIKKFRDIHISHVGIVGGKNSSLGQMFTSLQSEGIKVPDGFATTADVLVFLDSNKLRESLQKLMDTLDKLKFSNLKETGAKARELILQANMPADLSEAIVIAYKELCGNNYFEVAVRSSATAKICHRQVSQDSMNPILKRFVKI